MGETDRRENWVLFWWAGPCLVNLQSNFLLIGRAVFPPYCLTWGQTMVEIMKIMVTSFKRFHAGTATLSALNPEKARKSPPPKSTSALLTMPKSFDCVDHNKLWEILKEMGISDHLNCLLRNLYVGQEATVRTRHGTTDWFQIGKGVHQGCILSPCLFNLYAEYIIWNAGLDEAQAGIKIAWRNINNLKYADDTTLMAES